jgi:molybdopterin-binding protein
LSVRNHLHGRVRHVLCVADAVFAAIDIGQILWTEITRQAAAELPIAPGIDIVCLQKSHSLTLVS